MKLLTTYEDEMVTAIPDWSNYVYVLTPQFVHLVHRLDGSQSVISLLQFQTILHQVMAKRNLKNGS